MRPVAEMDAGPVCLERALPIAPDADYGSLSRRLAELAGELLVEALDEQPDFREQPEQGVTIAEKIGPEDRRLDPVARRPGARAPRARPPPARRHLRRAARRRAPRRASARRRDRAHSARARRAGRADDGRLLLGTADGALELLEVQPAGGRPMDADAYLRGHGAKLRGGV